MFGEMRPESTKIFQQSNPCLGLIDSFWRISKKSDEKYESVFHIFWSNIDMNATDSSYVKMSSKNLEFR